MELERQRKEEEEQLAVERAKQQALEEAQTKLRDPPASGGANIRAMNPNEFSVKVRTEPHFVLFDVDRKSLVGRAINLRGDTFDDFVVPPNPPNPPKEK